MAAIGHQEWKVITRKVGPVVPVDVAPDELLSKMRWLREKPIHNIENIMGNYISLVLFQ